jgi:hypothetical protein
MKRNRIKNNKIKKLLIVGSLMNLGRFSMENTHDDFEFTSQESPLHKRITTLESLSPNRTTQSSTNQKHQELNSSLNSDYLSRNSPNKYIMNLQDELPIDDNAGKAKFLEKRKNDPIENVKNFKLKQKEEMLTKWKFDQEKKEKEKEEQEKFDEFTKLAVKINPILEGKIALRKKSLPNHMIDKLINLEREFYSDKHNYNGKELNKKISQWIENEKKILNNEMQILLKQFDNSRFYYNSAEVGVMHNYSNGSKDMEIFLSNDKVIINGIDYDSNRIVNNGNREMTDLVGTHYKSSQNLWLSSQLKLYNILVTEINSNDKYYNTLRFQRGTLMNDYDQYLKAPNKNLWQKVETSLTDMTKTYNEINIKEKTKKNKKIKIAQLLEKTNETILEIELFKEETLSLLNEKINDLTPFFTKTPQMSKDPNLFKKIESTQEFSSRAKKNLITKIQQKIENNKALELFGWKVTNVDGVLNFEMDKSGVKQNFNLSVDLNEIPINFINSLVTEYTNICCKDKKWKDRFKSLFQEKFMEKIFQKNLYTGAQVDMSNIKNYQDKIKLNDNFYFLMAIYTVMSYKLQEESDNILNKFHRSNANKVFDKPFFLKNGQHAITFDGSYLFINKWSSKKQNILDLFAKKNKILIIDNNGTYKADLTNEDIQILNDLKNKNIDDDNLFIQYIKDTTNFDMNSLKKAILNGLDQQQSWVLESYE